MKAMEVLVVANANSEMPMYVSRAPSVVAEVGITRNFSILTNIGTQGLLKTNLGDSSYEMVMGTEYLPMVEYASRLRTLSQLISVLSFAFFMGNCSSHPGLS